MKIDLVATGYIFSNNKVLLVYHNKLNKWVPVGGHIYKNETPDDALRREVKEETNLSISILGQGPISTKGNVKRNLAIPFYVNTHSVGDHDHCSFFYSCKALNPDEIKINKELKNYQWFSKNELNEKIIPIDVKSQALKAFKFINN
jgi:ADP-ribose pyrophosphatase YjhB (NUDIX family)